MHFDRITTIESIKTFIASHSAVCPCLCELLDTVDVVFGPVAAWARQPFLLSHRASSGRDVDLYKPRDFHRQATCSATERFVSYTDRNSGKVYFFYYSH